MRVDRHILRVFLAVFEKGSVTRTAELFGVKQSTISHSLEKMRAAVADLLFVKVGPSPLNLGHYIGFGRWTWNGTETTFGRRYIEASA
ncbi:MAG: LysR family transcriptional regulator [Rhodobacteraceae bacterium]|nr:LysR family transcriptional regulator [Paracoccaceae bacterium]